MERNLSEEFIAALKLLDYEFSKISEITQKIQNEEERVKFRQGLGQIIGNVYTELMVPILRQYPDLDPDKDSHP